MRVLEIILLLIVTIIPFAKRPLLKRTSPNNFLGFLGFLLSIHFLLEGWRWQMIPAYLLAFILAWRIMTIDTSKTIRLSFLRIIGYSGIVILLLFGWILPMALPVFTLPKPTGAYNVGTQLIHIKTDREEIITSDPSDKRELIIKVWYPSNADVSSLDSEKYIDEGSRAGFAMKYGLPANALHYLDHVDTYVYQDISIAEEKFPVLIFSHGYGSKATGYYALLTELASQGYVIINMNHTYESLGTTFPDGRISYFDYDFQKNISTNEYTTISPMMEAFKGDLDYEQRHPIIREGAKKYFVGEMQNRWAEDIIYTIGLLEKWNTEGFLKDKLDLDKVGMFGHSVGGGTAGNVAMKDSRIKAAINIDGNQWGNLIDTTLHLPYLYISQEYFPGEANVNSHIYINKSTDYFYETKLLGARHSNFMDIPYMIPIQQLAGTGSIDPYLLNEIVCKLIDSFFEKHLKNEPNANLQNIADEYDLLEMTIYKGD